MGRAPCTITILILDMAREGTTGQQNSMENEYCGRKEYDVFGKQVVQLD
jgi:hypothetical protein